MVYNPLWGEKYFQIAWKKLWILMRSGGSGSGDRSRRSVLPAHSMSSSNRCGGAGTRVGSASQGIRAFLLCQKYQHQRILHGFWYVCASKFPECVDKQFFLFLPSFFMCLCVYSQTLLNTVLFIFSCFWGVTDAWGSTESYVSFPQKEVLIRHIFL